MADRTGTRSQATTATVEVIEARTARVGDCRSVGSCPPGAAHHRRVVLRGPHGTDPGRPGDASVAAASPHRPPDRHLAVRGGRPPPRQPRLRAADPSRAAQPDDGRRTASSTPRRTPADSSTELHGLQLWVAQPAATRAVTPPSSTIADLPRVDLDGATATVLVGQLRRRRSSPARRDTDHVGVELALAPGDELPSARPRLRVRPGRAVGRSRWSWTAPACSPRRRRLPTGRCRRAGLSPSTGRPVALLIGGVPFAEEVRMWWNFVARSHEELTAAYRDWATAGAPVVRRRALRPRPRGLSGRAPGSRRLRSPPHRVGAPPWSRDADAPGRTTP